MKRDNARKYRGGKIAVFLLAILLWSLPLAACSQEGKFGVYLVDTGELVFSEKHVEVYEAATRSFVLNEQGQERWNSFQTYEGLPKLDQTLTGRDFAIRINDELVCRGKFWSYAISAREEGIVLLDSLMPLNSFSRKVVLQRGSPEYQNIPLDAAITDKLNEFFKAAGKLE